MILIFGGTTEGRRAAAVCDEAGKPYFYSTKSNLQQMDMANGVLLTGAMDEDEMRNCCISNNIRLIIDAAHPFAELLHHTIATVAETLQLPVVRYERLYPERDNRLCWFASYQEAIDYLITRQIEGLLALSGVNTIAKLKPYWQQHECWFRILDRDESRAVVEKAGFPMERICYYKQGEDELLCVEKYKPKAIITKESGETGGFSEKVEAALRLNIPVLVIKRPALPSLFVVVNGEHGLRKQIERLLPGFYELRTGFTTGSCATAATKAAFLTLLTGLAPQTVAIHLPNGEEVELPILRTEIHEQGVTCTVCKDAGDDPDVTHGQEIVSTVQWNIAHAGVHFLQGEGVGVVTLPGLGLEIGGPAINQTPRAMMEREIMALMHRYHDELPVPIDVCGVDVTISVPNGRALAGKTFNPKLGIEGGISIIGTSGIVRPFSSEAFIASIRKEMQVARALGCTHIVANSGAKSERYIKQEYPDLPLQAFIHYGNCIGDTIKNAAELGFSQLTIGLMIGKAVKLAEGALDTHSKKSVMNKEFLLDLARDAGCKPSTIQAIANINMARQLWEIIPTAEHAFFVRLLQRCREVCQPLFAEGRLQLFLIGENGEVIR